MNTFALILSLVATGLLLCVVFIFKSMKDLRKLVSRYEGEIKLLDQVVGGLIQVPTELVEMLSRARSKGLVEDFVVDDAERILELLPERSAQLASLKEELLSRKPAKDELGPTASAELERIEPVLEAAIANDFSWVVVFELSFGRDARLGSIKLDSTAYHDSLDYLFDRSKISLDGPIKQLVEYLSAEGFSIRFRKEVKYANYEGVEDIVYQVMVRFN